MEMKECVDEAMGLVRGQARWLDGGCYEEYLERLKEEIEKELELCAEGAGRWDD